ncbi:hypothetical protein [Flavobacterium marginilacus]|uniref:hypothetical protein n=1 Tax=Flavobacterium marginilacus TaxID=3003256 RepID=UPI00248E50CD|nr:hypothetical protein [Flavobacterium marginilacus]
MNTSKYLIDIGKKYILGSKVPYTNLNYTDPWDCAEFISWCVYKVLAGMRETPKLLLKL